jgi:hypothetical protein
MKRFSSLVLVSTLPAFLACDRIDSSDVRTSGVQPLFEAVAAGNGKISVTAELRVGGPLSSNFLDLVEGDQLVVNSGDQELVMTRNVNLVNQVYYTAELEGDEEDKGVQISFVRTEDESAPSSALTMPAPVTFTAPEPGLALVGGSDDLEIAWDNSGKDDPLTLIVNGYCIDLYKEVIEDDGSHVMPANTLTISEEGYAEGCDISITLERSRVGTLDPAFDPEGTIHAIAKREVEISFTP